MFFRVALILSCFLFQISKASAEPRFAIEEGVGCNSCHTNLTGAGKRNDTGGAQYMHKLMLEAFRNLEEKKLKDIGGRINPYIAFGADFRTYNRTFMGSSPQNSFTLPQGSAYLELNAGPHLTGYADYDLANTSSREIFAMAHDFPAGLYLKAGRINLPYGLRTDDDTSPIRSNLSLTYSSQDLGAEIGLFPGPFEMALAVTNGVPGGTGDENLAKAITSSINWICDKGRIGSSFQWNKRTANRLITGGLNGGFKLWRFIFLGEGDLQQIQSRAGAGTTYLIAGYGEMDFKITEGFYLRALYDYLDPDYAAAGNVAHRVSAGIDLFPLPFSQVSVLYRANFGPLPLGPDEIFAQAHFFF
ncbi:MAG: hypothetical protein Q7T11_03680 [Deltaproteobacteria bacterium]|nr:hypothetical protein [Deltaproteobacteria bacterium]